MTTRRAMRVVWIALTLVSAAIFAAALPTRAEELYTDPYNLETGLKALGLSTSNFVVYSTVMDLVSALLILACGLFLYQRRPDDHMVWLVSLSIILSLDSVLPVADVLREVYPAWQIPLTALRMFGVGIFGITMLVFPDGRWFPEWTRWLAWIWIGYCGLAILIPNIQPMTTFTVVRAADRFSRIVPTLFFSVITILTQAYRYRYAYSRAQKQQVKWVILGLAAFFSLVFVLLLIPVISPEVLASARLYAAYILLVIPAALAGYLLFPLSLVFAVLRYRLWDIDVIIRRTLQYALLSGLLALAYFLIIVVLQNLFTVYTDQQSPIVIVVSTLAVAALFNPLRHRVQDFIDRRFYREKYSAEQELIRFASAARDEVDVEKLTALLLGVVEHTMQPERLSIWVLRGVNARSGRRRPYPPQPGSSPSPAVSRE